MCGKVEFKQMEIVGIKWKEQILLPQSDQRMSVPDSEAANLVIMGTSSAPGALALKSLEPQQFFSEHSLCLCSSGCR